MMKSTFYYVNPEQEKTNKAIKNIISLILYYILMKIDQQGQKRSKNAKKCQKMPKLGDILRNYTDSKFRVDGSGSHCHVRQVYKS